MYIEIERICVCELMRLSFVMTIQIKTHHKFTHHNFNVNTTVNIIMLQMHSFNKISFTLNFLITDLLHIFLKQLSLNTTNVTINESEVQ